MSVIRITENLTFDTINRRLCSDKLPDDPKTLGLAAVFCLKCLIEAQGQTVSQEKLIYEGWQKHGLEVSAGNLRQVISQIRKALSSLRESPGLLVTVPKMGYRLTIQTQACTVQNQNSLKQSLPQPLMQTESLSVTAKRVSALRVHKIIGHCMAVLLVVGSGIGALNYFVPSFLTNVPEIHYVPLPSTQLPNKKFSVDKRIANAPAYIESSLNMLTSSIYWQQDDARYEWVYLNESANHKMATFFLCDNNVKNRPLHCITRIFIEE